MFVRKTTVESLGWYSMLIIAIGLTFAWFLTTFSTGCGYCGVGNYSPNCPYTPAHVDPNEKFDKVDASR